MVLIQKTIMCRLNLANVSNQFCPDYRQMRLDELKKQYVGYCSHGLFITRIVEILQSSQIRTNSKSSDGKMHVDLLALVEGVTYEKDEIIPDAKIAKVTDTIAIATSKYASININIGKVNILKVGDVTPVIVRMAQYNKFTDKIAIAANIFIPAKPKLYMVACEGEYKEDGVIQQLLANIKDCRAAIDKLGDSEKKSVVHFDDLIYPYKKAEKYDSLKLIGVNGGKIDVKLQKMPLLDAATKLADGMMLFIPESKYLDGNIYIAKAFAYGADIWKYNNAVVLITGAPAADAYKLVLIEHYKKLYAILKLAETYPNKDALMRSNHVWKFYEMNKSAAGSSATGAAPIFSSATGASATLSTKLTTKN